MTDKLTYSSSLFDFHRARRRAGLQQILARFTGRSTDLLSYDEVREKLHARGGASRGIKDIPLDAIVGSVGRYTDFTRGFLPKQTVDGKRWVGVGNAVVGNLGLPPIEAYKLGDIYFVLDGNHRVSIAREMGARYIEAYVTEVYTRVPISPGDSPDDLILKERYAEFLEKTKLDALHPKVNLTTTAPGQYRKLLEHIDVHRYYMGIDSGTNVPYPEAVSHWYEEIYTPVVDGIRQQNILRDFPSRTETDLYIWVMEHQDALAKELGWHVDPQQALADLVNKAGQTPGRVLTRVAHRVAHTIGADTIEPVTGTGPWRKTAFGVDQRDRFARDILVPVSGQEDGWAGLELAIEFAQREGGRIHGLHVVSREEKVDDREILNIKTMFDERCLQAGATGELTIEVGSIISNILERARWVDVVILQLFHPPGIGPLERLGSNMRTLIMRSPVPILTVPVTPEPLKTCLLAYDGSAKARESLFIGAYMAQRWNVELVVCSVHAQESADEAILDEAKSYLDNASIKPKYIHIANSEVGQGILEAALEEEADLIIMGGYGHAGILQAVLGSSVDHVLRESRLPTLICC